jgi:ABC-type ATPase with predicted acetyltransferase domain
MRTCVSGKRAYTDQLVAEEALIEANIQYDYTRGNGPVAVYQCDYCGQFHLTSRGPANERLTSLIKEGKLAAMKQSSRWTAKFKKR